VYLKDCLIENIGPIEFLDVSLPFNGDLTPKPIVLVGKNGSGKSVLLSYVVDALTEFAKISYQDIVPGQEFLRSPFFKFVGPRNQRTNSEFGIGLLQFNNGGQFFSYVDKSGILDSNTYADKLRGRFEDVKSWPREGNHKKCTQNKQFFEKFFEENSVCYFPPSRKEIPHWLNQASINEHNNLGFRINLNINGTLGKPIFIESCLEENKAWLLDVVLDSMVDFENNPSGENFIITSNTREKLLLKRSREAVDNILKQVLQDSFSHLGVSYRNNPQYRLCILGEGDRTLIPSLDHLSSGQSILFNLFITIIRYADKGDINNSIDLEKIVGIVLIDEVDAHLDAELQYDVLPKLLKQFPRVQFILTTHSPLFLLGMENQYGEDGFAIIEMPKGQNISTERFSEFGKSFEFFKATKAFEEELQTKVQGLLSASSKPMVLLEGKTDLMYINKALRSLGRNDLLERIDIDQVGINSNKGSENSGSSALEKIENIYANKKSLLKHKLLLLYDCDTNKQYRNEGNLFVEAITKNENDCAFPKGIENLLSACLLKSDYFVQNKSRFYRITKKDYEFNSTTVEEFDKDEFCKWICEERDNANDFKNFNIIISILEKFLETNVTP
jgi:hypothetical protein